MSDLFVNNRRLLKKGYEALFNDNTFDLRQV
jgi:hypothetical protein